MKIKNDFVTNSSSTSFVGWGVTCDGFSDLPEIFKKALYEKCREDYDNINFTFEEFKENLGKYDWSEYIYDVIKDTHLQARTRPYSDDVYIAIKPSNRDVQDMTINQIIKLAEKELNELGFNNGVYYMAEAWYDG